MRPGAKAPHDPRLLDVGCDVVVRYMRELETIESGVAARAKQQILNWVIFWHHLK
jgi:hypothetical protein